MIPACIYPIIFYQLAFLFSLISADLPIHCLADQLVGSWLITMTKNVHSNREQCGYSHPDVNKYNFNDYNYNFRPDTKITLKLHDNNKVFDGERQSGSWTMVYDEGVEISHDSNKYFAFMEYKPKEGVDIETHSAVGDYISYCSQTRIGWFHGASPRSYGCFIAKKISDNISSDYSFLELGKETHQTWKKSTHHQTHGYVSRASSEDDNDIFVADIAFVEAVNENVKSTWKAKVHQQFVGKKMKHMHKLLGRRRFQRHLKIGRARVEPTPALLTEQEIVESDQLPEKWDWRNVSGINYLTPVRNQGSCGSCYAMSALAMFESRLKISSPELGFIQLSPQDVLSCSSFNQGCDGGYPYLVAKFGAEYSLTEESCLPYTETDSIQCESEKDQGSCYKRYTVQDYHYVGGFYGGCNEYSMMKELMENGPIAVALHAPGSLLYYHGGIFDNQMMSWDKEKKEWEQTNHAVTAVGWGVDLHPESGEPIKYWILRNTWGDDWGEDGYFRWKRGGDFGAIESMAVAGTIQPNEFNRFIVSD